MNKTTDDKELVQQFQQAATQKTAFETIVRKYSRILFAHLAKYIQHQEDIEDTLQVVWIKVWRGLESFRGESLLSTWLFTITTREAYNFYRKKKVVSVELENESTSYLSDKTDYTLDSKQIIEKLQNAIDTLPDKQKEVFVMRYFEEKTYEEMSRQTGTSEGALKASYHHAVKKIEDFIKGN
ncbi:MAG: sigma-70 family RNA polymerase sigma factor [Chitinophagales bacterium]|nr:sigma-70 family RNA polymerase sigma factor [Chitinophagales bacterium]